jgi:predicted Zn finger-like uncharacterized protein
MIIVCQSCNARLQIDDDKSPSGVFTIRCPKCKSAIQSSSSSPASEQSAFGVGGSPSTEHPRYVPPTARAYQLTEVAKESDSSSSEEVLRTLMTLLSKGDPKDADKGARPSWSRRKVLVCTSEQYREGIARSLTENGYQVFVAEDTRQAVETMRANQMDLVLMEPQFDSAEQGAAFVVREINVLRPAQRRRLFFVLISPSLRTMDAHAAFLNNVNAIVNIHDVGDLPRIVDIALREYNELYRELNAAFHLTAL